MLGNMLKQLIIGVGAYQINEKVIPKVAEKLAKKINKMKEEKAAEEAETAEEKQEEEDLPKVKVYKAKWE